MTGTTSRRAVLGALTAAPLAGLLAAIPVTAARSARGADDHSHAEWRNVVAEFHRLRDADEVARTSGPLRLANDRDDALRARLGLKVGDRSSDPATAAQAKESFEQVLAAEDAHFRDFLTSRWAAVARVYETPAPSLAALVEKIDIAEGEQDLAEAATHIVADVRRLAGEVAQ